MALYLLIPLILFVWFGIAVVVALVMGPVLRANGEQYPEVDNDAA